MARSDLTPKQEKFCQEYVKCGNASEAYRLAYNAAKMKQTSIHRMATEVLGNLKIASRLDELRQPAIEATHMTVESHLRTLDGLAQEARAKGQLTAAIRAEELRGKVAGYYKDRLEIDGGMVLVKLDD